MTPSRSTIQQLTDLQVACRACVKCVEDGILPEANPTFSGNACCRIFLVGQAPGPVEREARIPFMGRAGRELFRWMARAGWESEEQFRASVYMCSVMRCFPGRTPDNRGDKRPQPGALANCSHWLESELALLSPVGILAVGQLAIARFIGPARLDEVVGSSFGSDPVVIPLPHPSGQSRWLNSSENRARLERALGLVSELRERCLTAT